jgi:hypothetical protein
MATSFSGGRSRIPGETEPPTYTSNRVNFITCSCESPVHPFCYLQNRVRTHAVLVIGLYELLGNPTTLLNEPSGPLKKQKQTKQTNKNNLYILFNAILGMFSFFCKWQPKLSWFTCLPWRGIWVKINIYCLAYFDLWYC